MEKGKIKKNASPRAKEEVYNSMAIFSLVTLCILNIFLNLFVFGGVNHTVLKFLDFLGNLGSLYSLIVVVIVLFIGRKNFFNW